MAKDLYKCYPGFSPVLRGASLTVQAGEAVAIMGPSGCGKSTMLHILGMLHAPDSGSITILDTDILKLDREATAAFRRSNMGFVMQSNNLFEHSTVFENVEFPLIYDNVPPQERWSRVIRALDLVRLSARVHYRSNQLSGGEQQRVAIARAMVNNPRILLADEPTGALDATTSKLIMENFCKLCHSGGVAMVMVTHDPKMAEYCDSIYTLEDGVLNCKKHQPVPFVAESGNSLLNPVIPLVRNALVSRRFPDPMNPDLLEFARRLHELQILSIVYTLKRRSLIGNRQDYSLALPIRGIGWLQRLKSLSTFFCTARHSVSIWHLWKQFSVGNSPAFRSRCKAFASAVLVARWSRADNTQFLYGTGARRPATVAWISSRLLGIPFAFSVKSRDLAHFNSSWHIKAKDAAFILCPTNSIRDAYCNKLPVADKTWLVRPQLIIAGSEEEQASTGITPGQPVEIVAMGSWSSASLFNTLLSACRILKQKSVKFSLSVLGPRKWKESFLRRRLGLTKEVSFKGRPETEELRAIFKTSSCFIAWPPDENGGELALPWYLCEAMAFGLGIIACGESPGFSEALEKNANCLQIAAPDPESLSAELIKLITDNELRKTLGDKARKDIRRLLEPRAGSRKLADLIVEAAAIDNLQSSRTEDNQKSPGSQNA